MNRNEWITQAARLQSRGQAFALVTVLSAQAPTSGKPGDKAVVTADGQIHGWIGGGCAQPAVIKTVRRALLDGLARKIRISPSEESAERELGDVLEFGMACHSGGTLELFVDPVMPAATLTVVGDSPVAFWPATTQLACVHSSHPPLWWWPRKAGATCKASKRPWPCSRKACGSWPAPRKPAFCSVAWWPVVKTPLPWPASWRRLASSLVRRRPKKLLCPC
jgi:hypothetical protein